jgi:hypothetical protein
VPNNQKMGKENVVHKHTQTHTMEYSIIKKMKLFNFRKVDGTGGHHIK